MVAMSGGPCAVAAETITMVTTGQGSAQEWPIFIAEAKGFMAENGVAPDLIAAPSTAAAMQQLAAGSSNLGSGGLTDPLRAIDKGAPISLLRVETQVPPYTLWAKPTIKSVAELRGKLINIGGARDITRIYLERTLIPNGVKPGDYDMIFAGTTVARFAALSMPRCWRRRSVSKPRASGWRCSPTSPITRAICRSPAMLPTSNGRGPT